MATDCNRLARHKTRSTKEAKAKAKREKQVPAPHCACFSYHSRRPFLLQTVSLLSSLRWCPSSRL